MKISTPRDLLVEELRDLYSAETQLLKALPQMAEAASSDELRTAFETHLDETQGHVNRLKDIGAQLGESMTGKKCKAMAGLVAEGAEIIEQDADPAMRDLALIGAAQKVEHYEIAGYGTTRTLAELAGEEDIAGILQETLDEEGETDKLLTKIASEMDLGLEEDEGTSDDDGKRDEGIAKSTKRPAEDQSAAARHLGGQPENDEDARAAGFESATAAVPAKRKTPAKAHQKSAG